MRLSVFAIAFTLSVATAAASHAQDTKPATGATKKVARGKKKKPVATPAPEPVAEPAPVAPPVTAAAPAPAPVPVAQTTTTSAVTDRHERDRKDREIEPLPPISAAPLLGISTNSLGFGVGARAGYTLPMKLYIGGQFMYQFGTSPVPEVSARALYPSVEVGYELTPVNHLMVRPYGGVGVMFTSVSSSFEGKDFSATDHSFLFYPGCTVTYTIPDTDVFVGGDARLLLATSYGGYYGSAAGFGAAFGMYATAGMRF